MGLVARLLSFTRTTKNGAKVSDVKFDPGGGEQMTGQHFSAAGDDTFPLATDYLVTTDVQRTGGEEVVGYVDPINTPKATQGDKRIYARDPATGASVVEVWLKNTGEATTENANGSNTLRPDGSQKGQNSLGSYELQANGDFVVNGVTIAANGDVTIPNSLVLNSVEVADHDHAQANDSGGNTEQDTGAMK